MSEKKIPVGFHPDDFVFFPAAVYNGNRFRVLKKSYPPAFAPSEYDVRMPVTITDVPRLSPDGSGKIELTTGDVSTPCVGVFKRAEGRAVFVFTVQKVGGENIGLAYENGVITLTSPARREKIYTMCRMTDNPEPWRSDGFEIPCRVIEAPCRNMEAFYHLFFVNRECMPLDRRMAEARPVAEMKRVQLEKFNGRMWREQGGFYGVGSDRNESGTWRGGTQTWQPGWVGGGMSSYALMKLGGALERERALRTLDYLFSTQQPSGFFAGICDESGAHYGDSFGIVEPDPTHLVRKSADALYFVFKHFDFMKENGMEIPQSASQGALRLCDRFVALWREYGQFGQFADEKTGRLLVGGSSSAAIASAALMRAARWFDRADYARKALESGAYYYDLFARDGFTCGGPGEILQNPDSESAAGLLESMAEIYAATGEAVWLDRARHVLEYLSSWIVSYNYVFPETCEFGRLGIRTTGTVFANVQNKHSAPGLCTLSGDSLLKVARWTGSADYLRLARSVARAIGQCMSTAERPIFSWNRPPERLRPGDICERVNMSDWEGAEHVGGVFGSGCWCETSNLLVMAEAGELLEDGE